jgi:hypothetical protein
MDRRHKLFLRALAIVAAVSFLFVVIYPYIPTPIALSIAKTLIVASVVLCTFSPALGILVLMSYRLLAPIVSSAQDYSPEILDIICVRRR